MACFLESSCIVRGLGLPAVDRLGSQVGIATKQQRTTQASPECQRHGSPVVQQNIQPCEGLTWTENPTRTGTLSLVGDCLKGRNRGVQPIQEPSVTRTTLEDAPNNDRYKSGRDWRGQSPPPRVRLGAREFINRTSRSLLAANPSWEIAIVFCQSSIVTSCFCCSPTVIHFYARLT